MPAVSQRQQQFMGAELRRKRAGKKTRTGMSEAQLEEYAGTRRKGLTVSKGGAHGVVKRRPHGSSLFSDSDVKRGYRVI